MILTILLACFLTKAPDDLRLPYCIAAWSWLPYRANVAEVRWCREGMECAIIHAYGGGAFDVNTRTIIVDRGRPERDSMAYEYWSLDEEGERDLILKHEYGHALGLEHTRAGLMMSGWGGPPAYGPSEADFDALSKKKP